jgi:hypothetical protein
VITGKPLSGKTTYEVNPKPRSGTKPINAIRLSTFSVDTSQPSGIELEII